MTICRSVKFKNRNISKMNYKSIIIVFNLFITLISCELFTALVHLETLLKTEEQVIASLEEYLSSEEERLSKIREMKEHFSRLNAIANRDVDSYLSNPINTYSLVKRLTTDWTAVKNLVLTNRSDLIVNLKEKQIFPSPEDLLGTADALIRLQNTYKLSTKALADFNIPNHYIHMPSTHQRDLNPNKQYSLTTNDCIELAKQVYGKGDFYNTMIWMQEALDRHEGEGERAQQSDLVTILEYLSFVTYKLGNVAQALRLTEQLLKIIPDHVQATNNQVFYREYLEKEKKRLSLKRRGDDGDDVPSVTESKATDSVSTELKAEQEVYEALCRGEKRISTQLESKLKCFHLNTTQIPFLRLMRIKVEEAYKRPQVVVFHDFLSDSEIKVLKTLSEPKLNRATITNPSTGQLEYAEYRISKSAWLKDSDHKVVKRISRLISAITGLDLLTAEDLQVVNYGIGGHYSQHYDYSRNKEDSLMKLGTGNRIATWMNYMSDVEAGGATVFLNINVTIWPKKSSAAFWYNLKKSGEGDSLTRHAACPVLFGSKWVSNKWIHEAGQEFRKPCGKSVNEYNIVQRI